MYIGTYYCDLPWDSQLYLCQGIFNYCCRDLVDGRQFTVGYDIESLEGAIELLLYEQKDCTRDVVTYTIGLLDPNAL